MFLPLYLYLKLPIFKKYEFLPKILKLYQNFLYRIINFHEILSENLKFPIKPHKKISPAISKYVHFYQKIRFFKKTLVFFTEMFKMYLSKIFELTIHLHFLTQIFINNFKIIKIRGGVIF